MVLVSIESIGSLAFPCGKALNLLSISAQSATFGMMSETKIKSSLETYESGLETNESGLVEMLRQHITMCSRILYYICYIVCY